MFAGCTSLTSTGLATNTTLTYLDGCVFQDCTSLTSTGLDTNTTLTSLEPYTFEGCTSLTSTGLATNTALTTLDSSFSGCTSLTSTGLEDNTGITLLVVGTFDGCTSLTSTGLEANTTLTSICDNTFSGCTSLTSTGLATNTTLTSMDNSVFKDCTSLTSTGLETNTTFTYLGLWVFQGCTSLTSTGLTTNTTIGEIYREAFEGCSALGQTEDPQGTSNLGDLVLNQPQNGDTFYLGENAFAQTNYRALYLMGESAEKFSLSNDGSVFPSTVEKLYVPASWLGITQWDRFSTNDGSLVIMDALQGITISAHRPFASFDEAQVVFSTNQSFYATLSDDQGASLGSYTIEANLAEETQEISVDIARGLVSREQKEILAQVTTVYPFDAPQRSYNAVGQENGPPTCILSAVKFSVLFKSNTADEQTYEQTEVFYGLTPLAANPFARPYYVLKNWSSESDGGGVSFQDQVPLVGLEVAEGGSVRLYAQWESSISLDFVLYSKKEDEGTSSALQGAHYVISSVDSKEEQYYMDNLYTDEEKHNQVTWPQVSQANGYVRLYGMGVGTYYLFNTKTVAGYECFRSSYKIVVSEQGQISINDEEAFTPENNILNMAFTFYPAPKLPTTGVLSSAAVQGLGVLVAVGANIAVIRHLRRRFTAVHSGSLFHDDSA